MNKKTFVARVQQYAETECQLPISVDKIDDWVESGVLNNRNAEKSTTPWTEENLTKAKKVCRLNMKNVAGHNELICALWLDNEFYPISKVEIAFCEEYRRCRRSLIRSVRSTYFTRRDKEITPKRKEKIIKQMGEPSPLFSETNIVPDNDLLLSFYDLMRYGENPNTIYMERLEDSLVRHLKKCGFPKPLARLLATPVAKLCKYVFSGMTDDSGDPDNRLSENRLSRRNNLEKRIYIASQNTPDAFYEARDNMHRFIEFLERLSKFMPRWNSLSYLPDELRQREWPIGLFILSLNITLAFRSGIFKDLSQSKIPFLQKWLLRILAPLIMGKNTNSRLLTLPNQSRLK